MNILKSLLTQSPRLNRVLRIGRVSGAIRLPVASTRPYSVLKVLEFLPNQLAPKCKSCGVQLQNEDKEKPGFYRIETGEKKNPKKDLDSVYQKALRSLSEEDQKMLSGGKSVELHLQKNEAADNSKDDTKIECIRCREIKFHSRFDSSQFPIESPMKVLEKIPPWAQLVYVVSAQDFPLLLDSKVFELWPARQIQFVITKADLLFPNNKSAQEKGLRFFQDYLERTYHIPREQVFIVSGHVNWGISNLLGSLKDDSFFIGSVNCGKSTLLQSLIYVTHLIRSKLPNAKREREMQKDEDHLGHTAIARKRIKELTKFKEQNGPGVSYMPGFTRSVIPIELSPTKTAFDVPGFGASDSNSFYEILGPAALKKLLKGVKFHKNGMYNSHYDTVKAGLTLTVGGLFFLTIPPNCMYRVKNLVNHPMHVFRNMDKAVHSWKHQSENPALKDVFLTDSSNTDLIRYEIPPFTGSFDLVIKNFGFLNITATGKMPDPMPPIFIYLPRQVSAVSRDPIAKFITKSFTGRDKNGNPLKKENIVRLSTKEIKRYVGHQQLIRPLIWAQETGDLSQSLKKT
ncbi:hypothetical protein PUMCH_000294 [Australozyma saopauloensis]|uniref:Genetic interactor of prohibitins 3, mitochondrial n=1 Tax=Australozyma saopauloensis TaxID=291208 RepID=A0AAX4H5F5_9ASCO|nr:hypothetical protein PUMCH_000294 [[Candida] saopauloensis]